MKEVYITSVIIVQNNVSETVSKVFNSAYKLKNLFYIKQNLDKQFLHLKLNIKMDKIFLNIFSV